MSDDHQYNSIDQAPIAYQSVQHYPILKPTSNVIKKIKRFPVYDAAQSPVVNKIDNMI